MQTTRLIAGAILAAGLSVTPARAADVAGQVAKACGGCHQLQGPAIDAIEARRERKAPPLFYAGNKFREEWLIAWLQDPRRIRPAGDYPAPHVQTGTEGDRIEAASLIEHPVLDASNAKDIGAYLMSLTPNDALIAAEDYTPGSIPTRIGAMDFVKFKGCAGCHRDTPELGGVSGPELYTAWERLRPEFVTSYIRDPMAWEPNSLMPNKHLKSEAIYKLANYLKVIGEATEKKQ